MPVAIAVPVAVAIAVAAVAVETMEAIAGRVTMLSTATNLPMVRATSVNSTHSSPQISHRQHSLRVASKQHERCLERRLRAQDVTPLAQQYVGQFARNAEPNNEDGILFHGSGVHKKNTFMPFKFEFSNSGHQGPLGKHDLLSLRHERMPRCSVFAVLTP